MNLKNLILAFFLSFFFNNTVCSQNIQSDSTQFGVELIKESRLFSYKKNKQVFIPLNSKVVLKLNNGTKYKGTLDKVSNDSLSVSLLKENGRSVKVAFNNIALIQVYKGLLLSEIIGPTLMVSGDFLMAWMPLATVQLFRDGWGEYSVITIPATFVGAGVGYFGRHLKGRRYRSSKGWQIRMSQLYPS